MTTPLTVFISYASEDDSIANELNNTLVKAFGKDVLVYMDSFALPKGGVLSDAIRGCIIETDLLIVISTGRTRIAHSWCGVELGAFQTAQQLQPVAPELQPGLRSLRGAVVCLCWSGDTAPPALAGRLHVPLAVSEAQLQMNDAQYAESIRDQPEDGKDPFIQLLYQIHESIHQSKVENDLGLAHRLHSRGFDFRIAIRSQYLNRLAEELKNERQLLINYDFADLLAPGGKLSSTATFSLRGRAGNVFGLPDSADVAKPWTDFEENAKKSPHGEHWLLSIRRQLDAVNRLGGPQRTPEDSPLLLANDGKSLYQPILTTLSKFNNGRQEASIYLVEIQRRTSDGREETTRLLNGIECVCRFRFLFLEADSPFRSINAKVNDPTKVSQLADRIVTELSQLKGELAIAGLDNPAVWIRWIDVQKLQEMMVTWDALRISLTNSATKAISNPIQASPELAKVLDDVFAKMRSLNMDLLEGMANSLVTLCKED